MNEEVKKLQKEEEILYKKFKKFLDGKTDKEKQEFFNLLGEYVDVQIRLEEYCGE